MHNKIFLNEVENDFIDFLCQKVKKPHEYIKDVYLKTRSDFQFHTPEFRAFSVRTYDLNKLLHDEITEEELINTYQYHELMSAFRFLSYTFEVKEKSGFFKKIRTLCILIFTGNFTVLKRVLEKKKELSEQKSRIGDKEEPVSFDGIAEYLADSVKRPLETIVDYGCGPAYISFEIAKLFRKKNLTVPKVVLVDVDCLMKDFVIYRFSKYNLPYDSISVNKDNLYPILPEHDLCIATEVMEHLRDPIKAFSNINSTLRKGGVLYGNYENHAPHMLHVSPNLSLLRERLQMENYKMLSRLTYMKD